MILLMKFSSTMKKILFKVGLSPSKKVRCICFNENILKMMKNDFSFLLKALFVLEIFQF